MYLPGRILINSGEILLANGDSPDAGRVLERALQIDPRNNIALALHQQMLNHGSGAPGDSSHN